MQVVDNQAISVILIVYIQGVFWPTEGNFMMQVVVYHAFQSDFLPFFPFPGSKYTGGTLLTNNFPALIPRF
jgi:hypothetical protein